ncbi:MAG: type II secretion system F family protein [Roseovarius sp.]
MPDFSLTLLIVPLAALAGLGLLMILAMPSIEARARRKRRMAEVLGVSPVENRDPNHGGNASTRRKAIEETLKEIEQRQSAQQQQQRRPGLGQRLREAGMDWSPRLYWLISATVGVVAFAAASSFGLLISAGAGAVAGLFLPRLYVGFRRKRRLNAFAAHFPDTIDVIVRGVRAGRPLVDCLAIVANDTEDPIRSEFRLVVEDQSVGIPLQEAVDRLAQRVPLQEVSFLAIVIAIQSRAGGSLTEALGNLSTVLRGRRQLQAKVKAMSAEAKTSAGIIGSLPVIVAGLVQLTSPEYLAVLYQTDLGMMVLAGCAIWMSIGVFVMRQMINFDM